MKQFRVGMLLVGLLAWANAVQAFGPPLPEQCECQGKSCEQTFGLSCCPVMKASASWFNQAMQQSATAWKLLCGARGPECDSCEKATGCCESGKASCPILPANPPASFPAQIIVTGSAECKKPIRRVPPYSGFDLTYQLLTAPACCCVKECACCDTCKATKNADKVHQPSCTLPTCPPAVEITQMPSMTRGWIYSVPQPPTLSPSCIYAQKVCDTPGNHCVRAEAGVAHLATADLDAYCQRMTHSGTVVLLEGDVRLVCKKNGQEMRIEAQRVTVNVKDGSFVVESASTLNTPTGLGAERMSTVEMNSSPGRVIWGVSQRAIYLPPALRVIQVMPTSAEEGVVVPPPPVAVPPAPRYYPVPR